MSKSKPAERSKSARRGDVDARTSRIGRDDTLRWMKPLSTLANAVLPALVARAPLTPEKVTFAWSVSVGPAIQRATDVRLRGGVLDVRASDPAWIREIERSRDLILTRVQHVLGHDVVRSISITRHG